MLTRSSEKSFNPSRYTGVYVTGSSRYTGVYIYVTGSSGLVTPFSIRFLPIRHIFNKQLKF